MRNFKLLRVQGGLDGLAPLLRGEVRVVSGLPVDAKCIRAGYDPMTDDALFIFESVMFPEVPDHFQIPPLSLLYETKSPEQSKEP